MKKTSRKILVPLIVLALGIAMLSKVGAVENFGQKPGPGPILDHSNNPGPISGQKPGNDDFKFNPGYRVNLGHKPDNDFNQWNKGQDFRPGFQGYWNYLNKPCNWYHQFKPYYNQYNK